MTLKDMKEILDAEILVGHDKLDLEITKAGCADSMDDVLVFGQAGMLLLTGLTNPQIIHTAHAIGIAAIIIVRGKRPPPETIQLAEELQIPLLSTRYILFETVGRLYAKGMVGNIVKVEEKK
jgi:predicted transcriptional regulator